MTPLTYPKIKSHQWRTITPRETIPVYPPPEPLEYPSLPSQPRQFPPTSQFTLSTHIIPAAHLRTFPYAPLPLLPSVKAPKAERMARHQQIRAQLSILADPPPSSGHPIILWICLNRYVRSGATGTGLTLIFAHANGFPKETWEPTLHSLLSSPTGELIDEIWSWEAVQHGDSALLNEDTLGSLFDWADNGRDILNFLHYFIPTSLSDVPLPMHLRRVDPEETRYRESHGFKSRTFIGIGHSYGGCAMTFAALENPKLFSSLILIDPVIMKPYDTKEAANRRPNARLDAALNRRDSWPSKEEALASFREKPFFSVWDPDVLQIYADCGLYDTLDPTGQPIARLKISAIQEAIVFAATMTQYETYQRIQNLDERIELRWIVPGVGELGPPGSTQFRVWLRPKNSSNVIIPEAGHLIPQEAPRELAHEIDVFLWRKYRNVRNLKSKL